MANYLVQNVPGLQLGGLWEGGGGPRTCSEEAWVDFMSLSLESG